MKTPGRSGSTFGMLAGIVVLLALLRFLPVSSLNSTVAAAIMVGFGWLVYQLLEPLYLLRRRAFLREVYAADGGVRRFFWRGTLRRAGLAVCTLMTAALALMTVDALASYEWTLLVGSVPGFGLVLLCVDKYFGPHWQDRHRARLALWTAYAITLVLLTTVIVAWQILMVEVPVVTHMAWHEVLTQAFTLKSAQAVTPEIGWLLGLNAAASDGAWYLMQTARIAGDTGRWAYLGGCAVLLGWNAMKLGSVWLVLLGATVVLTRLRVPEIGEARRGVPNAVFIVILCLLLVGLPHLNETDRANELPTAPLAHSTVLDTWRSPASDPCAEIRLRQRREVSQRAAREADALHSELDVQLLVLVDQRVDAAFASAERAVDRFLDWNFSIEGQYAQLAYLAASAASSNTFEGYIASQVDAHVHSVLDPMLGQANEVVNGELAQAIEAAFHAQDALAMRLVKGASCLEVPESTVRFEDYMNKSLVGAGVGTGIISTRVADRMGARMVSQVAAKRAIATVAAKGATRTATTAKSGLTGLACGPYAVVCVPLFAGVAWFGTDVVINTIDESLHRDEMREEMLGVIEGEKKVLKEQLRGAYLDVSAQAFQALREYQVARFNIYRDGG